MLHSKSNKFTQNFSNPKLEASYRSQMYESSLTLVHWMLFSSLFFHILFLLIDWLTLNSVILYWYVRGFVLIPTSVIVIIISFTPVYKKYMQYINSFAILVNGSCEASGTLLYGDDQLFLWVTGTVVVAVYGAMLLGLRFIYALTMTWTITLIQLIVIVSTVSNQDAVSTSMIMLLTTAMFISLGCYVMEGANRRAFLISQKLITQEKQQSIIETSRNRWLEQMASFLRHELRNAVNGARTSLELLGCSRTQEDSNKYLERGNYSIKLISELLNSVSNATSLESAFYKEKTQALRLDKLLDTYSNMLKDAHPEKKFIFDLEKAPCVVKGQDFRITQMLDKIVENAVDHTEKDKPIEIRSRYPNGDAIIEIKNYGKSLPENKDQIFDLFASFRDRSNPDQKRGYGLYIARLIAQGYKGALNAYNVKHSTGAKFVISLPRI